MPAKAAASHEITALLRAWEQWEPMALEHPIPLVYRELKSLAPQPVHSDDCRRALLQNT
jgi:hypothetical protein